VSGHRSHPVRLGARSLRRPSWRRSPEGDAAAAIAGRCPVRGRACGDVPCSRCCSQGRHGQLSVTAAAAECGFSRRHLHRLLVRYREGGLEALEPRSRAPRTNPAQTPGEICERVIELRAQLTANGLDAGPVTIAWHLEREGLRAPAPATISRILTRAGM